MEDEKVYVKLTRHEWPDERAKKRRQRWIARILILAVLISFTTGWIYGGSTRTPNGIPVDESKYARLDAIISLLESTWYYGKDVEDLQDWLIQNAIDGMLEINGDPYTDYMTAQEILDFEQSINRDFVGIGVQFYALDGVNIVERVFKNSPAERFGVMPGDIIYKVEGIVVEGMPTSEIADIVRGEIGTIVTIEFIRGNQTIVKEIERGEVKNSAYGEIINGTIGLLEIYQFGSSTHLQVKEYLDEMAASNVNKLIIDLRDNGGGYLDSLLNIASFFLEKDTVVIQQKYKDGRIEMGSVSRDNFYANFEKIVVLVNGNTASASEVLTAALKEQANITVIGETTFGKGSVQITRPFSDGSALKLTSAQWLTPKGNLIQDIGITPDIEVKRHPVFYHEMAMMGEDESVGFDQVSDYVTYIQKALDFIGYEVDRMDGYMSANTVDALNAFKADKGLEVTGLLTGDTYKVIHTEVLRKWYTNRRQVDLQLQVAISVINE